MYSKLSRLSLRFSTLLPSRNRRKRNRRTKPRDIVPVSQRLQQPHDQDYGSHDFMARDPEGHIWSFVDGVFGTRRWMQRIGQRGGATITAAKSAAARANGKKGGRPRTRSIG